MALQTVFLTWIPQTREDKCCKLKNTLNLVCTTGYPHNTIIYVDCFVLFVCLLGFISTGLVMLKDYYYYYYYYYYHYYYHYYYYYHHHHYYYCHHHHYYYHHHHHYNYHHYHHYHHNILVNQKPDKLNFILYPCWASGDVGNKFMAYLTPRYPNHFRVVRKVPGSKILHIQPCMASANIFSNVELYIDLFLYIIGSLKTCA